MLKIKEFGRTALISSLWSSTCGRMFSDGYYKLWQHLLSCRAIRSLYQVCLHSPKHTVSHWFHQESVILAKRTVMGAVDANLNCSFAWRGQATYQCIVSPCRSDSHRAMRFRVWTNERLRVTLTLTSVTETSLSFFTITSCCIHTNWFNVHADFTAVCVRSGIKTPKMQTSKYGCWKLASDIWISFNDFNVNYFTSENNSQDEC